MTSALRFIAGTASSIFLSYMASRVIIGGDSSTAYATIGFIGYMGGMSIDVFVCLYHLWFSRPCSGRGFPRCAHCTLRAEDAMQRYYALQKERTDKKAG